MGVLGLLTTVHVEELIDVTRVKKAQSASSGVCRLDATKRIVWI